MSWMNKHWWECFVCAPLAAAVIFVACVHHYKAASAPVTGPLGVVQAPADERTHWERKEYRLRTQYAPEWEYTVISYKRGAPEGRVTQDLLNEMGKQRWELCAVTGGGSDSVWSEYYFKRRLR